MKARELIETCRTRDWFQIRVDNWAVMCIHRNHLKEAESLIEKDVVDWGYCSIEKVLFINVKGDEE